MYFSVDSYSCDYSKVSKSREDYEKFIKSIEDETNGLMATGIIRTTEQATDYVYYRLGLTGIHDPAKMPDPDSSCVACGKRLEIPNQLRMVSSDGNVNALYLCEDHYEKALIVLADAFELPDWD